ncbi:MAG: pantoate--beta-alanine ligase [Neisseriaceae bacterium]
MQVLHTLSQLQVWCSENGPIALVPTMGNLHRGHTKLLEEAKNKTDAVLLSIFVNPTQFGENEDFNTYPRTLETDLKKAEAVGSSAVFCPSVAELFPYERQTVWVRHDLSSSYCGQFRPIFFRGIATVVTKLFHLSSPRWAFFGKKDFQQLVIIRQMVEQLNFPVEIIGVETQRDPDGLALASRNQYLTPEERKVAPQLQRELKTIKQAILDGAIDFRALCQQAVQRLSESGWEVDYIEVAHQHRLEPASPDDCELVILAAARLGTTRLIDNLDFQRTLPV